ncbi:lipoprotein-releasing system permease protein [Mucilaginibacter pineti]|uniref:Lipoprotein-releasing system permease protein n=1 Tax=Mucilaginibacter pineti TaxID=1391627 RepID=A0A1G6WV89_9SPHI|nr:FtsX-like permease family protein [Mucilaginibacter pineti]SDD68935.1 lipoprotein-releasing system permease protein [Mucilaginibacter pineti]
MSFASFISARITFKSKRTFSKLIVRIAIVGIMLGLGVMILSLAIVKGFKHEIREKVRGFAGDIRVLKYDLNGSYESSPFLADSNFVKRALKSPLITRVMPFATKPGIIKANNEIEGVVLKGVDKSYDWSYFKRMLVAGQVIDFTDSVEAQKEIMLSQTTADRLKLKVGDKLLMYFVQEPLRKRPFKIKGIFNIGVEEVDKTFVIGDLSLINRLNGWKPNEIGAYEMRVSDFERVDYAADKLDEILPIKLKSFTVTEDYATIFEWLKLIDVNSVIMLVLMIVVAVINMISALLIMILERTAMIGMFKAMGASNWNIQKIFLLNATYLIGLGLLLGNTLGLGLGYFQQHTHFFKLDPASYYMNFVPVQIEFTDVLLLNIGTLAVCLLVLLIPSMLVSKISPVKAIRFK